MMAPTVFVVDSLGAWTFTVGEQPFEPFFTTDPRGMDMGLATCLTIAEMHRGRSSVEPGFSSAGTTARFLLPLEVST